MDNKESVARFGIGFVLGTAIGLVLALILAPKSGKEARELLKDKLTEIPEAIKEQTANPKKVYTETWRTRKGQPKISPTYFE